MKFAVVSYDERPITVVLYQEEFGDLLDWFAERGDFERHRLSALFFNNGVFHPSLKEHIETVLRHKWEEEQPIGEHRREPMIADVLGLFNF